MTNRAIMLVPFVVLCAVVAVALVSQGDYMPAVLLGALVANVLLGEVTEHMNRRIQEEMQKQLAMKDGLIAAKDERIAIAHRALGWDEEDS